ncbi:MAG: hypothetical protein A2698_02110 [Candidatus Levybacteria bacterium RIFCSPHIGHO2_01_FULL_42_15]|nr:MAG: hypothetical protein A2698_02110 [Candidatus Levybacteria bacterium RIFCSPHIGHO2_01_FULL_42_15]
MIGISVGLFVVLGMASFARANHHADVLGVSTSVLGASIPPTVEGPGYLLPDSPLFFLDKLKQNTRLFLAFTPENKAKVYADVAGERLAELRFMLAKHNEDNVRVALEGVESNIRNAGLQMAAVQFAGKRNSELAKTINDSIKLKQESLDILEAQVSGDMLLRINVTQKALVAAKVRIEEQLNEADMQNEIDYDVHRELRRDLSQTLSAAKHLELEIDALEHQASEAAQASLSRRERALKSEVTHKSELLLTSEKQTDQKSVSINEETIEQVTKIVKSAQDTAAKFKARGL